MITFLLNVILGLKEEELENLEAAFRAEQHELNEFADAMFGGNGKVDSGTGVMDARVQTPENAKGTSRIRWGRAITRWALVAALGAAATGLVAKYGCNGGNPDEAVDESGQEDN